ncbi:hypothetical protein AWC38_SpisGene16755 [Stylophora pistillata]|uniref:Uncharacterized protein n=1 Tax=Stylophora pistillata TaxID=50429 RepID=A0A2B4RRF6_STYPI|nr:hypothetical protein AWC38_SpisGene16755 [Stylophora pistillata]
MAKRSKLKRLDKEIFNQSKGESLRTITMFYVKILLSVIHLYHPLGAAATIGQYVDKRILEKLLELVKKSITNLGEVKHCLDQFVERKLFCDVPDSKKPRKTNRRHYPSRKDLRNRIAREISAQYSNDDQESLRHKIEDWCNLPNRCTFTDHGTSHQTKELKQIPQKRNYIFSSTKKLGKRDYCGIIYPDSYQHYLRSNLKFSSVYGRYISSVPAYLQNRPLQFAKLCLKSRYQRLGEYQDGDLSSVNFQKGEYNVKSSRKDNSIEDTEDAFSKSSLSELPDIKETPKDIKETEVSGRETEGVKTGQPSLSARLRKNLQEQLNAVKEFTFLVDDNNILREALSGVKPVYDMLTKNCPNNHGLLLRNSPVKKKLKLNQVEYHQVFHKKLPKGRKWKKRTSTPIVLPDKLEGRRKMMS